MTASSAGDRAGLARPAPGDGGAGLPAAAEPPPNGPLLCSQPSASAPRSSLRGAARPGPGRGEPKQESSGLLGTRERGRVPARRGVPVSRVTAGLVPCCGVGNIELMPKGKTAASVSVLVRKIKLHYDTRMSLRY